MTKQKDTEQKLNDCLEWIVEFMINNSRTPTLNEVADNNDISQTTARAYLQEMNGRKMIEYGVTGFCLDIVIPGVWYADNR